MLVLFNHDDDDDDVGGKQAMNVFWNSLQIFVFVSKNALCV